MLSPKDPILKDFLGANISFFRRFYKLPKQIPRGLLKCEPFRMPLDSKSEWMVREFDGFDEPVRCMARNTKGGRDILESLMVMAVHFDDRLAQHICNTRAFFNFHFVHEHGPQVAGVGMVQRVGELIWEMSVKSPT